MVVKHGDELGDESHVVESVEKKTPWKQIPKANIFTFPPRFFAKETIDVHNVDVR